ncbi:MAG: hypothetical protein GY913_09255 [Proteobacteria bacterium]|nr:hypothetical protein [Pseudomonadota bacterium]MCP4917099.1 hypothetical protein [Pseudomonadota bacterium]
MVGLTALGLSLLACSATRQGLMRDDGRLQSPDGGSFRLVLKPEDQILRELTDLTVEVEGRKVGKRIAVQDWSVLAAQDGSAPFLGPIRQHGANLVMEDRNSGTTVVLDGGEELAAYAGHTVLVIGYVDAAHVIVVMGYRVLD